MQQSNLCTISKNLNNPFIISKNDVHTFLGIAILSSVIPIGNTQYWYETIGNKLILEAMSVKDFEQVRANLHFNDNSLYVTDTSSEYFERLYKIRPVMDSLQKQFKSVPIDEYLSLDEQICATKARNYMKTYNPQKPHKWGYRFYVLCGVSGYEYNF